MTAAPLEPNQLGDIGLFSGLDEASLAMLAERGSQTSLAGGELLFEQGARGRRMFVILEGEVDLVREGDAEPVTLATLRAGDWCGEMSLIDVLARPHSARARSTVEVLSLDNRTLDALYRANLKMYALLVMNLARQLSRRLRACQAR